MKPPRTLLLNHLPGRPAVALRVMLAWVWITTPPFLQANPSGGQITSGNGSISQQGSTLTINQGSDKLIINWQDFSIQQGEITRFLQSGPNAAALNRVLGGNPSEIYGLLEANGAIYLINPNGILIGPTGQINTGSFVASTLDVADEDFLNGGGLTFSGNSTAKVRNEGTLQALDGDVFLIGQRVENAGTITALNGTAGLAAGTEIILKPSGDEKIAVSLGEGSLLNSGTIQAVQAELKAAGGNIYALAIQNTGTVQATGVENKGGRIFLKANTGTVEQAGTLQAKKADGSGGEIQVLGGEIHLASGSLTDASGKQGGTVLIGGDYQGKNPEIQNAQNISVAQSAEIKADGQSGDGGKVIVWSDGSTEFHGSISATGGGNNGKGGFAEVSGKEHLKMTGHADLRAESGVFGTLLLDPGSVTIQNGGNTDLGFDTFNDLWVANQLGSGSLAISTSNASTGSETITINGNVDITWSAATTLTLNAGQNIVMNSGAVIENTNAGGIAFDAIVMNANTSGTTSGDFHGIHLQGTLETDRGNILLTGTGGDSSSNHGLYLEVAAVQSVNGNVDLDGTARGATAENYSVIFHNSTVLTTGSGNISITGTNTGTGTGANNLGIYTSNSGTSTAIRATGSGSITLTGTGGGAGLGDYGVGVYLGDTGTEISTNSGDLIIVGNGSTASSSHHNMGIWLTPGGQTISSTSGNITLTGTGGGNAGSNTSNAGIRADNANNLIYSDSGNVTLAGYTNVPGAFGLDLTATLGQAANTGDLTLTANTINIGATAVIQGSGDLLINPTSTAIAIGLGTGAGTLSLTASELARIQNGFTSITIGSAAQTGAITVNGATFKDSVSLLAGGSDGTLAVEGTGLSTGSGTQAGALVLTAGKSISVTGNITTQNSDITLLANGLGTGASNGIYATALIAANGGDISLTGTGTGGTGTSNGIFFDTAASGASTTGSGTIYLNGQGASSTGDAVGIYLRSGANISAVNGDVTLIGTGATSGTALSTLGVYFFDSSLTVTGTGDLLIQGTGGASSFYANGFGMDGTGAISTNTGSLTITGTGAAASNKGQGMSVNGTDAGGSIRSNGGAIDLTGTATGGNYAGVEIGGATATSIQGGNGTTITMTGTGSGTGSAIRLNSTATDVLSTANQTISLNGSVNLNQDTGITTGTGAGDILFSSTIDGAQALTLNAGTGSISFGGAVGGTTPLTGLYLTSGGTLSTANQIRANNLLLQGTAAYTFSNSGNDFMALAADLTGAGSLNVQDASGGSLAVGTVNGTNGITTAGGAVALNSVGTAGALSITQNISTSGGNLTLFGYGTVSNPNGLTVSSANLAAGGGAISLTGNGGNNGTGNNGIYLSSANVTTTGTGTITLAALGGNTTDHNRGLNMDGTSLIQTVSGAIVITGQGQGSTTSNEGVIMGGTAAITTTSGNVTVTASSPAGTTDDLLMFTGTQINGGSGLLTINANKINLGAGGTLAGSGDLILQQLNASDTVGLGGAAGTFNLDAADLASLQDGFNSIIVGRTDGTGTYTINGSTWKDPVTFRTTGTLTTSGLITGTGDASLDFDAPVLLGGSTSATTSNQTITFAGTINGAHALTLNAGASAVAFGGAMGDTTPLASLSLTASGGALTQSAAWKTGTLTVNAGANAITLNNSSNDFTGAVSLSNSGTNNVAITDANALQFGSTSLGSGSLTVITGGAITQSGAITQASGAGAASFSAGANAITLDNSSNDFTGAVSLSNSGTNNVAITDANALQFGSTSLGSGSLTVITGGTITQSGAITQASGAGAASFSAGANAITLTQSLNSLTGPVLLSNSGVNNVAITNSGALDFGTSSLGSGSFNVIASGNISQSGAITQASGAAASSFDAGANTITLDQAGNDFTGTVTAAGSSITLRDANSLVLGLLNASNSITLQATGNVTQTAALTTSNLLLLGSANYTLTQTGNTLVTLAASTTGSLEVVEADGFAVGTVGATNGISATSVVLRTLAGNLTLNQAVTATSGDAVLAAAGNFINTAGAAAVSASGRWLVYTSNHATATFGGLASGNLPVWGETYTSLPPGSAPSGSHYIFANQPALTATAINRIKTYGQVIDYTNPALGTDYTVTGFIDAALFGNVWTQETAANATSGNPALSSPGASGTASVAGSTYVITLAAGTLASETGYQVGLANGTITVNPAPLTVKANNQSKLSGTTFVFTGKEFTSIGLQNGENINNASISSAGAAAGATDGNYPINISNASGGSFDEDNYVITYQNGNFLVDPLAPPPPPPPTPADLETDLAQITQGLNNISDDPFNQTDTQAILNGNGIGQLGADSLLDELFVEPGGAFILGDSSGSAIPLGEAPAELQNALGDDIASALQEAMGEGPTPSGTAPDGFLILPGEATVIGSDGKTSLGEAPPALQASLSDDSHNELEAAIEQNDEENAASGEKTSTRYYNVNPSQLFTANNPGDTEFLDLAQAPQTLQQAVKNAVEQRLSREASK